MSYLVDKIQPIFLGISVRGLKTCLSCSFNPMTFLWLCVPHSIFSSLPYMLALQLPVRNSFHLVLLSCFSPASRAHFSLLCMRSERCRETLIPQTVVSESSLALKSVCFLSHLMRLGESLQPGIPLVSQNNRTPYRQTHTSFLFGWLSRMHAALSHYMHLVEESWTVSHLLC